MPQSRDLSGIPVALVAVALVAGEVAGFHAPHLAGIWPWVALLAVFAFCLMWGMGVPGGLYVVVALVGASLALRTECGRLAVEIRSRQMASDGSPPAFELQVDSDVEVFDRSGGRTVSFMSQLGDIPVKVVALADAGGRVPVFGETWRCAGRLHLRKGSPSRYSMRTLWVMDGSHMSLVSTGGRSVTRFYRRLSDRIARYADTGLGWCPELAAIGKAMLLGRRAEVPRRRKQTFVWAGTIHVFAISGLHVMLVASAVSMLLHGIGLPLSMRSALAIPILAAFVMVSGCRPSAVRAAVMASLWLASGLLGREPDSLSAWGYAALAVYGLSPAKVFDAGCALSFGVMLGIVAWIRWSRRVASPLDCILRLAAREQSLGDAGRTGRLLSWHGRCRCLLGALGVSFAAWIAGTPIAAFAFGRLTFGGVLANLVVVPLAGVSVVLGMMGTVMSVVSAPLGALVNNLSALCVWLMVEVSELVALCPCSSVRVQNWGLTGCAVWYGAWVALFALLTRILPKRETVEVMAWR